MPLAGQNTDDVTISSDTEAHLLSNGDITSIEYVREGRDDHAGSALKNLIHWNPELGAVVITAILFVSTRPN